MRKLLSILLAAVLFAVPVLSSADVSFPLELSHEWASFDMGDTHSAAIQPEGLGYAWGYNYNGPIGNGSMGSTNTPTPYNFASGVSAVYANGKSTLFIKNGTLSIVGQVWYGTGGSSGMPSTGEATAAPIVLANKVRSAAMGFNHLLYVKNDNTLWAYGENGSGQIGDNTTTACYTAKQILTDVAYAAAGNCVSAAVKTDGTLWMWGRNSNGQVGNNDSQHSDKKTPVQVLTDVFTVSVMGDHVCAIKNDGTLWTWGSNSYGQLGNGNTTDQIKPVRVLTGVAQVSAGMDHTGVIKTDGSLWFCGRNYHGCFGSGTTSGYTASNSSFIQTPGQYVAVNCGNRLTAALSVTGQLFVAGENRYGQLGTGSAGGYIDTLTPIDVWVFNSGDTPVNTYTVTFVDWNGTVLKEQEVNEGEAAEAPNDPVREGYVFTGWDKDYSCVKSDLTVTALYEPAPTGRLLGDANCDGKVDFDDVTTFYAYILRKAELTAQGLVNADMNEDGSADSSDVARLWKYILGIN
ncbi:MAG: InlB B-repeat-containing protein [Clostridiales bacterium]|nr:InlB B-repeat-containing protein [Clostridiales bacterium]